MGQDWRSLGVGGVKTIDVLSHKNRISLFTALIAVLKELSHCAMPRIDLLAVHELVEVVIALPRSHGVRLEELHRCQLLAIRLTCIGLFSSPKTVLAAEGRNATGNADASTCDYCKILLANHFLCCLSRSALLRSRLILLRLLKASCEVSNERLVELVHHIVEGLNFGI